MATATKTKALRIATRCVTVEQFVATFHRFCDETSFFISTLGTRAVGLETAFSIQLEGGKPVLQGLGVVLDAWTTPANRFNRPGVRLGLKRLTNESVPIFKQLMAARVQAGLRSTQPLPHVGSPGTTPPPTQPTTSAIPRLTAVPQVNTAPMALPSRPAAIVSRAPTPPPVVSRAPTPPPAPRARLQTPPLGTPVVIAPRARIEDKTSDPAEPTNVDVTPLPPPPVPDAAPKPAVPVSTLSLKPELSPAPAPKAQPAPTLKPSPLPTWASALSPRAEPAPTPKADASSTTNTDAAAPRPVLPFMPPRPALAITPAPPPPAAVSLAPPLTASAARVPEVVRPALPTPPAASLAVAAPVPTARPPIVPDTPPPTPPPPLAVALAAPLPQKVEPAVVISDTPPRPDATPVPAPVEDTIPMAIDPSNQLRTPGSEFVLPANPLMNLSDESLTGFVDCTLYEETGNVFAEPGSDVGIDDVIEPPLPRTRTSPIVSELAEPLDLEPPGGRVAPEPAVEVSPELPIETPVLPRTVTPPVLPRVVTSDLPVDVPPPVTTDLPRAREAAIPTEHIAVPRTGTNPWIVIATLMLAIGAGVVVFMLLTNRDKEPDRQPVAAKPPPVAARAADPVDAAPAIAPPDAAVVATIDDAAVVATIPDAAVAKEPAPDEPPPGPIDTPAVGAGPCKLTVHSTPAGSMISINGESAGPSPITVSGPCAARTVEISHPRYQSITRVVTPTPDKPAVIDETLVRPTHTVTIVTTPPGAEISIDGRHAGTSPTAIKVLGFTSVELSFKKFGFLPQTRRLYSKVANDSVAVKLAAW